MTIGLEIGYDAIRLIALEQSSSEGHILNRIGHQPLPRRYTAQGLLSAGEAVTEAIRSVMEAHGDPDWPVVLGVQNRFATVVRSEFDKSMDAKTSFDWMLWEAEQAVVDPIEQYSIDVALTGHETDTSREAFIIASRHELLNTFTMYCENAGVYPVEVNVASVALINAFEITHPLSEWETAALLHLEPGMIDIIFFRGASFDVFSLPLDPGDEQTALSTLGKQLGRKLNDGTLEDVPDAIFVAGSYPGLSGLCAQWSEQLDRPVHTAKPFENLEINPKLEPRLQSLNVAAFMVATGLALQVRQDDTAPSW